MFDSLYGDVTQIPYVMASRSEKDERAADVTVRVWGGFGKSN